MHPDRRGLIRGLVTFPLIGGGVTLIGRAAEPVPLADVAVAPILENPRRRARYAWEAFAAAMSEVTAGSDGWHVHGGRRFRSAGRATAGSWLDVRSLHVVPIPGDARYAAGLMDQHGALDL